VWKLKDKKVGNVLCVRVYRKVNEMCVIIWEDFHTQVNEFCVFLLSDFWGQIFLKIFLQSRENLLSTKYCKKNVKYPYIYDRCVCE